MKEKIEVLAKFLDIDLDDAENLIDHDDYLVLTDDEADKHAMDCIRETLFAFNVDFLAGETNLPSEVFTALQSQYEDSNDTILELIPDFDDFVQTAISYDGRGHFISGYDGNENELNGFFIYRLN